MPESNQPENALPPPEAPVSTRYAVKPGELATIDGAFGYNPAPTSDQAERMAVVRGAFTALALTMHSVAPRGRLFAVAMTDLEKSCAAFVKAIAHEDQSPAAKLAREMEQGTARFASDRAQEAADKRQP